tara:strand:+ start:2898 stop:3545 length:648 start_codon:yes stop_codon:yes gene_type:complete
MSNYTIQVGWSSKDALADSDPEKVISGELFNTEFTAVQSAVNTKADLNGNAGEAFSATTAVVGTNSTQVATTAFVQASVPAPVDPTAATINSAAYPVGSVYTSVVATNPATLLGVGTWAAFSAGRVMLGAGGGYTAGDSGGVTTDSHALTVAEMPAHTHGYTSGLGYAYNGIPSNSGQAGSPPTANTTTATGSGAAHTHDIMQPYIVVYFWKRTA